MRRSDRREKRGLQCALVVLVLFTLGAAAATWQTFVVRPAAYETLRTRGVLADARVSCPDENCTLTYVYAGRTHKNDYHHDRRQFRTRFHAPVLIDPEHPETMYTVYDVRRNSDTGFGVLGILCLLGTAGVAVWTFSTVRALRRFVPIGALRPKPSASAPASAREALLAVYDAGDALDDGTFPSWSMTYRYDPDLLERAFGQLDERLAAMPGLEPEIRAIPAELTHRVRAAKHEPLIGGVRLDPTPLHFELSRVWRRVGIVALR